MDTLQNLAEKELERTPFTEQDSAFMSRMLVDHFGGCGQDPDPAEGWYWDLIYNRSLTQNGDYTIADVHTQPSDEAGSMVGYVLHAGVGKINLGVFLAESPSPGYKPMAYAGPVISYYQKITGGFKRLTGEEWTVLVKKDSVPARPDWVNCFLADSKGLKLPQGRLLEGIIYSTAVLPSYNNNIASRFSARLTGNTLLLDLPGGSNAQITLYDLRGRSMLKMSRQFTGQGVQTLSIPSASGVYAAVIKSEGKMISLPVNKVR
jgi:Protein of unknown function (DUF3160).